MTSNFNNINNQLFSEDGIKLNSLEDTENNKAVAYSSRYKKGGKTFANSEDIYNVFKPYLTEKVKQKGALTDINNNINFHNVHNGVYIDIDYHANGSSIKNFEKYNKNIALLYLNAFINSIEKINDETLQYYYFVFVPNSFNESEEEIKGGVHIMIFCNKSLSDNEKETLYANIIKYCSDNYEEENIDISKIKLEEGEKEKHKNIFEYLFDKQPWKSCNVLCPFGQKSKDSRQYKLYKSNYNGQNWFIFDEVQTKKNINTEKTENEIVKEVFETIDIIKKNKNKKTKKIIASETSENETEQETDQETEQETEEKPKQKTKKIIASETSENETDQETTEEEEDEENEEETDEEEDESITEENMQDKKPNMVLCHTSEIIYNFIDKLQYLSDKHEFWNIITDSQKHNDYYDNIIIPCIEIMFMYNILDAQFEDDLYYYKSNKYKSLREILNDIIILVTKKFIELCRKVNNNPTPQQKRFILIEQIKNIEGKLRTNKSSLFNRLYNNFEVKNRENIEHDELLKPINLYFFMKVYYDFNFNNKNYLKEFPNERRTHLKIWRVIQQSFDTVLQKFCKFITRIKDGITNEIEPFNKNKSYHNQNCYKEDNNKNSFKERITFYDVEPDFDITNGSRRRIQDDETNKVYSESLSLWITLILCIRYYENNFQLQGAITETLGAFIKQYICIIHTSSSSNKQGSGTKILIYNIRQTKDLESYPYNQWISDNNKNMINQWITKLYNSYIKKALYTTEKNFGLAALLRPLVDSKIIENRFCIQKIAPLPHAEKDITEMVNNIIKVHPIE